MNKIASKEKTHKVWHAIGVSQQVFNFLSPLERIEMQRLNKMIYKQARASTRIFFLDIDKTNINDYIAQERAPGAKKLLKLMGLDDDFIVDEKKPEGFLSITVGLLVE